MRLRVQGQVPHAAADRLFQQAFQQGAADTLAAPVGQHRHASDVPVRKQTPGTDRPAVGIAGDDMAAHGVVLIQFDFARYVLFLDKDRLAHLPRRPAEFIP